MSVAEPIFREANVWSVPIRDLKLGITGTPLEPILAEFERELAAKRIQRLRPTFYLSTEWGVPFGTVSIALPFYLARTDLQRLHAEQVGHIEGFSPSDILRYLRHEMGHVVNYAYRLYENADWVQQFGAMTQPYVEDYRPQPFSRRYVRHLPGWYAQKHPDEDWAETFAVWMTPQSDWRKEYAQWPTALAKLEFCDRTMTDLNQRDPIITAVDRDEDVSSLAYTLAQYYDKSSAASINDPPGLDGALRAIFENADQAGCQVQAGGLLIRRLEPDLMSCVFQWTGHFPERTRRLVRHLAVRADELKQVYPVDREQAATIGVTALVTALAMNYTLHGSYLPSTG